MKFTLVYDGPLLAHNELRDKSAHKHLIRTQFHPQLRNLWKQKLEHWTAPMKSSPISRRFIVGDALTEQLAREFSIRDFRFVPLVTSRLAISCKLKILFLRRESEVGRIVQSGDIDNRLKTLFDALRVPNNDKELGGASRASDEDPFYCLLEDDKLITEVHVRADTLLTPQLNSQDGSNVKLIIGVTLKPLQLNSDNQEFA